MAKQVKYRCSICGKGYKKASEVRVHYRDCKRRNNAFLRELRMIDILRLLYNAEAIKRVFSIDDIELMMNYPSSTSNEIAEAMMNDVSKLLILKAKYFNEKRAWDMRKNHNPKNVQKT